MRYVGSKRRIAKHIHPIMLAKREDGQTWVEPFVGAFNSIEHVTGSRVANDLCPYITALFKAVSLGWVPPDRLSVDEYNHIKNNRDKYHPAIVGFVGYGCSFGGKFFGGYARSNGRNHCAESQRNIMRQLIGIIGIKIYCASYDRFPIPANSLIYCDPPYAGSLGYGKTFGHKRFWRWCDKMTDQGHTVFVSEYNAPEHWKCVWEKEIISSVDLNTGGKRAVERLFTR